MIICKIIKKLVKGLFFSEVMIILFKVNNNCINNIIKNYYNKVNL